MIWKKKFSKNDRAAFNYCLTMAGNELQGAVDIAKRCKLRRYELEETYDVQSSLLDLLSKIRKLDYLDPSPVKGATNGR